MALTTPSQIEVTNSLRLSSPSAVKTTAEGEEFFQCLKHYATSPSSLTLWKVA